MSGFLVVAWLAAMDFGIAFVEQGFNTAVNNTARGQLGLPKLKLDDAEILFGATASQWDFGEDAGIADFIRSYDEGFAEASKEVIKTEKPEKSIIKTSEVKDFLGSENGRNAIKNELSSDQGRKYVENLFKTANNEKHIAQTKSLNERYKEQKAKNDPELQKTMDLVNNLIWSEANELGFKESKP